MSNRRDLRGHTKSVLVNAAYNATSEMQILRQVIRNLRRRHWRRDFFFFLLGFGFGILFWVVLGTG